METAVGSSSPIGTFPTGPTSAAPGSIGRGIHFRTLAPLVACDLGRLRSVASDPEAWRVLPVVAGKERAMVVRLDLTSGSVAVKRYLEPGLTSLRTLLRRCRAEREARALELVGHVLQDNPVRPVAWAEQRRAGMVPRCFLVTSWLEDSFDLRRAKSLSGVARQSVTQAVLDDLPRRIARLHDHGVFLRTLRGKNLLFQPATGRLALIDLPRARWLRRLQPRQRREDLATLSLELRRFLTDDEWRRFLETYRQEAAVDARAARVLAEQAVAAAAARRGHRTPVAAARHAFTRRLRHSRLGRWASGRRVGTTG